MGFGQTIKKGFKKSTKKFGKKVSSGSTQAFEEKGPGAELKSLLSKGLSSNIRSMGNDFKSTVKPVFTKVGGQAFGTLKSMTEKSGLKEKGNDIAKTFGLTKGTISDIFKSEAAKDGVTGISDLKSLSVSNIKNLKSKLNIEDYTKDAKSFLPPGGVNSINPMQMAKEAGIGNVAENPLKLKNVDITSVLNGNVKELKIGGSAVGDLTKTGVSNKIDISNLSSMLKTNKTEITSAFSNSIDLTSVENSFKKDSITPESVSSTLNFDANNLESLKMPDELGKFGDSMRQSPLDSIDYGVGDWQNTFDNSRIKDSGMDFTENVLQTVDDQNRLMNLQSMDLDNLPSGERPFWDSSVDGIDKAFSGWDKAVLGQTDDNLFTNHSKHAKDLSKKYTSMWGDKAGQWTDTYAGMLNGENVRFDSKIKGKEFLKGITDNMDATKMIINLKNIVKEGTHNIFGR